MIKCIIVDDEPLALQLLEHHISKIEGLQLIGKAKNAMEAYTIVQAQPVDLMFLDIQMPDLNGIAFLKSLDKKPKTIFTTAYREYAIDGFELEAVDYLLKPITFERFFKAIDRVLRNAAPAETEDFIILKSDGYNRKIKLHEIVYFESQGNEIKVVLADQMSIMAKSTISELECNLRDKGFVRIHRSFIINSTWATATNTNEVLLGTYSIPVGRSYKKEFDEFVARFLAKRLF